MEGLNEGRLNGSSPTILTTGYNFIKHITKTSNHLSDMNTQKVLFLLFELKKHHVSKADPTAMIRKMYKT
jgi:hypothetical protein